MPLLTEAKAASAASRPVTMRTIDWRVQMGGVVRIPTAVLVLGLEHRVEIHGEEPGGIDGCEPRRNADGPAQGHPQVGEVTQVLHSREQRVLGRVVHRAEAGP